MRLMVKLISLVIKLALCAAAVVLALETVDNYSDLSRSKYHFEDISEY